MMNFTMRFMGVVQMNNPDLLLVLGRFTDVLERLGIDYAIGGSVASSIYGAVRFTEDADVMVEAFDDQADRFFEMVKSEFYISRHAMCEALADRSSFNVIHTETAFKIDVFIGKDTAFEKELMSRRRMLKLSEELDKAVSVVSPEDIVLLKLRWYQDSGCNSVRQWADILGVLDVRGEELDREYLKKWSCELGLDELLERVLSERE